MVAFYSPGDQAIYNQGYSFIPRDIFRLGDPNLGGSTTTAPVTGGINTVPINMGGGGGGIPFSGTTSDLTTGFMNTITDRQNRLNNPSSKFLGFNTMRDLPATEASSILAENIGIPQEQTFAGKVQDFLTPQSADQIIAEGYQEPSFQPGIISAILGKVDRYRTLPRGDQAFIARNMGYTGPTVFGENASGLGKDPFGLNVRSGFGNYAERVGVEAEKLGKSLSGRLADKYGVEFDEETGMFVGANAATANQMTKLMRAKYNFYTQQTKQRDADRAAAAAAQAAAERRFAAEGRSDPSDRSRKGASGRRPGSGGTVDRVTEGPGRNVDDTGQAYDSGGREGFGYGLADGGRVPYMMGGLTNLVDIYD